MGLREKILNSIDLKSEIVYIEEWDVKIEVRAISGRQRSALMQGSINIKTGEVDLGKMYPELIILSSYDPETGQVIFSDSDREQLSEKNSSALEKIFRVASKLSGLDNEGAKKAEKN